MQNVPCYILYRFLNQLFTMPRILIVQKILQFTITFNHLKLYYIDTSVAMMVCKLSEKVHERCINRPVAFFPLFSFFFSLFFITSTKKKIQVTKQFSFHPLVMTLNRFGVKVKFLKLTSYLRYMIFRQKCNNFLSSVDLFMKYRIS